MSLWLKGGFVCLFLGAMFCLYTPTALQSTHAQPAVGDARDWAIVFDVDTGKSDVVWIHGGELTTIVSESIALDRHNRTYRLNNQALFATMVDLNDSAAIFYHITTGGIRRFGENVMSDEQRAKTAVYMIHDPYVILYNPSLPDQRQRYQSLVVLDLNRYTADFLTGDILYVSLGKHTLGFSEDGRFLRYVSREEPDLTWKIRERDLEVGTERIVADVTDINNLNIQTNRNGDVWLHRDELSGRHTLYRADGSREVLDIATHANGLVARIHEDFLYTYIPDCHIDCSIRVYDLATNDVFDYELPPNQATPRLIHRYADNALLIFNRHTSGDAYWLVQPNAAPILLGRSTQTDADVFTPDYRWAFLLSTLEANIYQLWDLEQHQLLHTMSVNDYVASIRGFNEGYLLVGSAEQAYRYDIDSDQLITLPFVLSRWYQHVFDNGQVLFSEPVSPFTRRYSLFDPMTMAETRIYESTIVRFADIWRADE